MSNTIIQIKRSQTTNLPTGLQNGELAYSFVSNTISIGDPSGNPLVIGGNNFVKSVSDSTSSATANSLVKRDETGSFSANVVTTNSTITSTVIANSVSANVVTANLVGNATTATSFKTPMTLGAQGDASGSVTFDGSANANVTLTLVTVNANVGTFGGADAIPVVTVDAKGRITGVSNTPINTTSTFYISDFDPNFTVDYVGNNITSNPITSGNTVNFAALNNGTNPDGLFIEVFGNTVFFNADIPTVNTTFTTGYVAPNTSIITGSFDYLVDPLIFSGTTNGGIRTFFDFGESSEIPNSIKFALDNTVIRTQQFFGNPEDPQTISSDLVINGTLTVAGNTIINGNTTFINVEQLSVTDPLIRLANNNTTTDTLSIGIFGSYGQSGNTKYTGLFRQSGTNDYYLFNGVTDNIPDGNVISPTANGFILANVHANLVGGTVSDLSSAIKVSDGGTGANSFNTGELIIYDGTKLSSLANSAVVPGTYGSNTQVARITVDQYGRVANVVNIDISQAINANTITGLFGITSGGTGLSSFGANTVPYYSGTGNALSYTNTPTDGQVLQFSANNGVQFAHLDGGTF